MTPRRLASHVSLAFLAGIAALFAHASLNDWQWRLFQQSREYLLNARSPTPLSQYFCDRCADFISSVVTMSDDMVDDIDSRIAHLGWIAFDIDNALTPDGAFRCLATVLLGAGAILLGLGAGRTLALRLGFVRGVSPIARQSARAGLRLAAAACSVLLIGAISGSFAWYILFERISTAAIRPIHATFIPTWSGVALIHATMFALATTAGAVLSVRCHVANEPIDHPDRHQVCLNCRYPLAGLSGRVCPECGTSAAARPRDVMWRKLGRSPLLRRSTLFAAIVAGIGGVTLLSSSRDEKAALVARIYRWICVKGMTAGAVGGGRGWPFVPLRPDRPISVLTDRLEIVMLSTQTQSGMIRYVVAVRHLASNAHHTDSTDKMWAFHSGEYPRPGPQFDTLVRDSGTLLLSDWSQAFLGPHGTFVPVHVRAGCVKRVVPLDESENPGFDERLRLLLNSPDSR